jgi:hypothetical protein
MGQRSVDDAHQRFKSNSDEHNSQVYPALARVPRELFGVCVVGTGGQAYEAGDTEYKFSIMSVSKPFVFALNTEARLRALKIGHLIMTGLALLAIIPACWLSNYLSGGIPSDAPGNRSRSG